MATLRAIESSADLAHVIAEKADTPISPMPRQRSAGGIDRSAAVGPLR